ncbi:5'-deoxynucleotidase HDDC2 isoform X3 [Nilaparvata lugens]|uniref:5'-deoxynucleotidase HDDC2 isoform X3 n=1 Tax=Nilaparvata lugens TaxID=108931 RepID=UPI000B992E11|nr:5'-deoxynucleotidase HDDC2 isoform X3 [Nilaparvata lugens]
MLVFQYCVKQDPYIDYHSCSGIMESIEGSKLLNFLELMGQLKHVKRTGWVMEKVENPETIAGHMYRMAVMCFLLDSDSSFGNLNKNRCIQLSLVHDMAECIVGDITPHCGVPVEEKHKRETEAMQKLSEMTGAAGESMKKLFEEYEAQETAEAKFVKELDRLDMVIQAFEYEKRDNAHGKLQEFFDSTQGKFSHPLIIKILSEVYKVRSDQLANNK